MNEIYLWAITAVTAAVALNTVYRLYADRHRLWQDELHDEDRLFAWRIVLFLVYPVLTLVDLRATMVTAELFGGYVNHWSYGMFWYSAIPHGLHSHDQLLLTLFAGAIVQVVLALLLIPALLFRPHPFMSSVIGYTIVATLGLNVILDPMLSLIGFGGSRWQLALNVATPQEKFFLACLYTALGAIYLAVVMNERTRVWFAHLSRPLVAEQLMDMKAQWKVDRDDPMICARLSLLYEGVGLRHQAVSRWKRLHSLYPRSIYSAFVEAMLSYRQRRYSQARKSFILASDLAQTDALLKGTLLAAGACSAFAEGDMQGALNLSERALEFDDASLVARMVKVDVFLRTGKKEQAGEEILSAIRRGLDLDLESKVPLDSDKVMQRIVKLHTRDRRPQTVGTRS